MKTLSVAIAAHNEEKSIGRCLESVVGWCDEIVLVDGQSIDRTVEIARQYGAKVILVPNQLNFHKNKQLAIDHCQGKWILQLDADEVVTVELKKEIIEVVTNNQPFDSAQGEQPTTNNKINGYLIPRKNYFLGTFLKKGGQYPDYSLRLYREGKGHLPQKSVHEQAEVDGMIGYLENPLFHFSYPDFSHYLSHFNMYTTIFSAELSKNKIKVSGISAINYLIFKPVGWFLWTYIRHKGFTDGFPGFVFSFFSAMRFPVAYIKYWEKEEADDGKKQ